jgi:hypothetical protein
MSTAATVAEGLAALAHLLPSAEAARLMNEADTRLQIIDPLIGALGWSKEDIRTEPHGGGERPDYELGTPRQVILEAKRVSLPFVPPTQKRVRPVTDLASVALADPRLWEAICQVQRYCANRGAEVGIVTNGLQLVAFLATRADGVAPLSGKCLFIRKSDHLRAEFGLVWRMLSPGGIREGNLKRLLRTGVEEAIAPPKLSSLMPEYPVYHRPTNLQTDLGNLAEFLLVAIASEAETERDFYENCYVTTPALEKFAATGKEILSNQYTRQFEYHNPPISGERIGLRIGRSLIAETGSLDSLNRRPIFILGDVGVGKTAFLRRLTLPLADDAANLFFIYIDLSCRAALKTPVGPFIYAEIARQLRRRRGIDIASRTLATEIVLHSTAADLAAAGEPTADPRPVSEEDIRDLKEDPDEYMLRVLSFCVAAKDMNISIIIDNADRRSLEIQTDAIASANQLAASLAYVFVSLQPHSYSQLSADDRSALSHQVFTISSPAIGEVISRRVDYARRIAVGEKVIPRLQRVSLQLETFAAVTVSILNALRLARGDLPRLLTGMSAGNVGVAPDFLVKFYGSSAINHRFVAEEVNRYGTFALPHSQLAVSMLFGRDKYYGRYSRIPNIYDMPAGDPKGHFLIPLILAYLMYATPRTRFGFLPFDIIAEEMQNIGFLPTSTEEALGRMLASRLVNRASLKHPALSSTSITTDEIRITGAGSYLVREFLTSVQYLRAVSTDTPLTDAHLLRDLASPAQSWGVEDQLRLARALREYLTRVWDEAGLHVPYFDWHAAVRAGEEGFLRMARRRV